jgi:peroxiredoxin
MKYNSGDLVNDFELINSQGHSRSLEQKLEDSKLMIVFFRGFW